MYLFAGHFSTCNDNVVYGKSNFSNFTALAYDSNIRNIIPAGLHEAQGVFPMQITVLYNTEIDKKNNDKKIY